MRGLPGLILLLLAASAFPAASALAGSFVVNPVRVTLSGTQGVAALTVRNQGNEATVVQLEVHEWTQVDGANVLKPTEGILATPPLFTLPAGGSQIIRVGLRRPADGQRELTYRLVLREVPPDGPAVDGLRVVLQLSLPVFVLPPVRATPRLEWKLARTGGDGLRLSATNSGNAHIQIASFSIQMPDGRTSIANQSAAEYLLPGNSRSWNLRSSSQVPVGAPLRLVAKTDAGEMRASLILESDASLLAGP
jgi:fimbrial chaperone protein